MELMALSTVVAPSWGHWAPEPEPSRDCYQRRALDPMADLLNLTVRVGRASLNTMSKTA